MHYPPVEEVLHQAGWEPTSQSQPYAPQMNKKPGDSTWLCGWRALKRHRYAGVTPDSQIRYRTFAGIRMYFKCTVDKPSRLLISSVAAIGWLRWLIDKLLKRKGFIKHPDKIQNLNVYHQDQQMVDFLLTDDTFRQQAALLSGFNEIKQWELQVVPGHLTVNISFKPEAKFSANQFDLLHRQIIALSEALLQAPVSVHHQLTDQEHNSLNQKLSKKQLLKGFLLVMTFLFIPVFLLLGLLLLLT